MIFAPLFLALLPQRIDPPAPFPHIVLDAPTLQRIAPGVESAEYDLITAAGPIVVHVVALAPNRSDLRVGAVLAGDSLTGTGETVSSMANRTGAVAGINGDYFDIGNTNAPTNIVVENGELVRTPSKRCSLIILNDGSARIAENAFSGEVELPDRTVPLAAINVFPPPDAGITLLTPSFGSVPPFENLTLVTLAPAGGTAPFETYSVTDIADNTMRRPAGYYLAIGLNAYTGTGVPNAGDKLTISGDMTPFSRSDIAAAIGGGPLLLDGGHAVDDPDGPNGGEFAQRIPSSGAAIGDDGTLFLLEVDGRQPLESVGVTRPEFAALMRALGASRGMALDGGGSSTLVVRTPGTTTAQVVNSPSDGKERPIADGMFAFSTSPVGPATQLVAEPQVLRALVGASFPVSIYALDDAEHVVPDTVPVELHVEPSALGEVRDGVFRARAAGTGALVAQYGALHARFPIEVSADPARVLIFPAHPFAARDGSISLRARAYDEAGFTLALPAELPWRASGARIQSNGTLRAGTDNTVVSLLLGDHLANVSVLVGSHVVSLPVPEDAHFMTVPRGGDGQLTTGGCDGCLTLRYQLGPTERAAYAVLASAIPQNSVAIAFDVLDDGSGANVRLALRNAINEESLVPVTMLDHPGWRHVVVHLDQNLMQPARLSALYVIGPNAAARMGGTVTFRNFTIEVAGPA